MGREWFPLTFRDPDERWRGVNAAAPTLDAFLDRELARHRLPPASLALVGFSQGTMMALHILPRRDQVVAGIVGFSGRLLAPELLTEVKVRPPKGQYGESNSIRYLTPAEAPPAVPHTPPAAPAAAAQSTSYARSAAPVTPATGSLPWARQG